LASLVFGIAKETGWDEDKILDMPLGRVWSYRHALLRSYDAKTFFLTTDDEKKEISELFKSL
jgi:hypothetical protein